MIRFLTGLILSIFLAAWTSPGAEEPASWTGWPKDWVPQSTIQYPPYPDVWWRENPGAADESRSSILYDAGGDDPFAIHVWWPKDRKDGKPQMLAQEFFSGRTWEPYIHDGKRQIYPYGHRSLPYIARTPFADGSALGLLSGFDLGTLYDALLRCFAPDALFLKDKDGYLVWRRYLVQILKTPIKLEFARRHCGAISEGEGVDPNFFVTIDSHFNFLQFGFTSSTSNDTESLEGSSEVLMLKDGTYLANPYGFEKTDNAYVIRFDKNLRSLFLEQRDDLFVVDVEELKPLLALAKQYEDEHNSNSLGYFDGLLTDYLHQRGSPYPK
ncbi:MAG: hypothetical protein NUV50_11215 [Rhodospirillales bacterium]|nr:hypothetical protein [Rhodospirillales bacterium]